MASIYTPVIYAYPLLAAALVFVFTRGGQELRPLQLVWRWLLALALAYGLTVGLVIASKLFAPYAWNDFTSFADDYFYGSFCSEGIGVAMLTGATAFVLLCVDLIRKRSKRETESGDSQQKGYQKVARVVSIGLLISLVLVVVFLIEPYIDSRINSQRVYQETHNQGLDPRDWFPFGWNGLGEFMYDMSFWIWSFGAFVLLPIGLMQLSVVRRVWSNLRKNERIVHGTAIVTTVLSALVVVTVGRSILYWLLD